ncbi:LysR family transcriptional regulator [Ensifer adhaerens]|uniref:LysR family transcriptional regulator n=1 Tax=Ensifer adhaerens TaxID=106592 RepID=UPI001CBF2F6C|nr:LysR family transcriptional regulator [Ensifer adhaerens]MBZ7924175.1 LysR family transcriptional regulator [Ensifer adhaerens]UAX96567.1 LysR family transcriptional regulator [Ensifer adhaerens]UAY04089.1 LysR family transcriptional regulator [Ensifer adhaerens]UAY12075.1 LysR family transcriptional regulator [Ensifer adhaerens]
MEWSDIRVFLAVAREGTLGAAGRSLRLSHPTISRRLRALENATGQMLFQRTSDGYVLTDEGAAVLTMAEQMEESALSIERRLSGDVRKLEGTLRISSPDWFGAWVLPPVIAAFARANDHVEVELLTGTRLFNLAQREADVAFRITQFEEPDVVQRRLLVMPYGVYMAKNKEPPEVGGGLGCSLVTMDTSLGAFPDIEWLRQKLPAARVALRSNNRNVQAQMSRIGIGISVLPRPVGDQQAELMRVDLGEDPPTRDIWMGFHRDTRRSARQRAFVDLAIAMLSQRRS